MIHLRGIACDPVAWFAIPGVLVVVAALGVLGMSLYEVVSWVASGGGSGGGIDMTPAVGVAGAAGSVVIAGAYVDATIAIVRRKARVGTWLRLSAELVVAFPVIWLVFGLAATDWWGDRMMPWVGFAAFVGFYVLGLGWSGVIRARYRAND